MTNKTDDIGQDFRLGYSAGEFRNAPRPNTLGIFEISPPPNTSSGIKSPCLESRYKHVDQTPNLDRVEVKNAHDQAN